MKLSVGLAMVGLIVTAPAWAAPRQPSAYDELRQNLEQVARETDTAMRLGVSLSAGSKADTPDPGFRQQLNERCGDPAAFRRSLSAHLVEETREPSVLRGPRNHGSDPYWRGNGRGLAAVKFAAVLPNHLRTVAETLPPVGKAQFLRSGESLKARPLDMAAAVRQRAEWLVVLDIVTQEVDRQRLAAPGEFQPVYALGLWSALKCDLALGGAKTVERQILSGGYPEATTAGADTERAFLLLVASARNADLSRRVQVAAREAGAGQGALDALERWAASRP